MNARPTWTITPLHVGTLHRKRRNFLFMAGDDTPLDVPVIMYLLDNGGERVLVDTGCSDPATTRDHQPFERPAELYPLTVLAAHGVDPASVGLVLTSHLHWDHSSGNALFPGAELRVQARELEYARHPLMWHSESYEVHNPDREASWALGRYTTVDGDTEILPGLNVLLTPGHTPGIQSVLVATEDGDFVLPSDNVPTYANWEGKLPEWTHIPATNHYSLPEYDATFTRLDELAKAGTRLLPSHDFRVLKEERYG
jgi:glyoxylase-like metal-dependent hydrolase (beta-lactamase superfamily II)